MKPFFSLLFLLISCCLLTACFSDLPMNSTESEPIATKDSTPAPAVVAEPKSEPVEVVEVDTIPIDTIKVAQKVERPTRIPAKIKFETTSYLYDTINQGDVVEYSFKFKNVGERPLAIKDVRGSCGCTIASYSFLDIAANEESEIKARFDSKGKKGPQFTTITVYSNANPKGDVLSLKGVVRE